MCQRTSVCIKSSVLVLGAAGRAANRVMEMPLQVHARLVLATWRRSSVERTGVGGILRQKNGLSKELV